MKGQVIATTGTRAGRSTRARKLALVLVLALVVGAGVVVGATWVRGAEPSAVPGFQPGAVNAALGALQGTDGRIHLPVRADGQSLENTAYAVTLARATETEWPTPAAATLAQLNADQPRAGLTGRPPASEA